ncbi:MAG: CBS domain-containing protein [Deltaproteobacteria bacterium]|nr:CBS domain-containing protein [Deltaproteobacteria bacterium]
MLIKEYMAKDLIYIDKEATIIEAAGLMKDKKVHRFPVKHDGKIVGIITDRDLRSAAPSKVVKFDDYERELLPELHDFFLETKVKDIMSRDVITVFSDQTVATAAYLMHKHAISGMPVKDLDGNICGIITKDDIFTALVDFSGIREGKNVFGFLIEDGTDIEIVKAIRDHGGRVVSGFSLYHAEDPRYRKFYVRIQDLPTEQLEALKKHLEKNFTFLYMVQEYVTKL